MYLIESHVGGCPTFSSTVDAAGPAYAPNEL